MVAAIAAIAAIVIAVVDGPRSIRVAAVVAGVALAPAAASVGGTPGALAALGAGIGAALAAGLCQFTARRLALGGGLDPLVPVVSPRVGLFGPRSVRVMGAALALLGASWVAINVPVSGAGSASGAVFAIADVFLVAVLRLLRGRALEELAVGGVCVAIAACAGWVLEAGTDSISSAVAAAALAPLIAGAAGWMTGRHHRRPDTSMVAG